MKTVCSPRPSRLTACAALTAALLLTAVQPAAAQPGSVLSHQKISNTEGGFTGRLDNEDNFGFSVASLGDLNGDGVGDLAVGASSDDDGGTDRGAVWVLFLNTDGTVESHQKISDIEGGFTGTLDNADFFGTSVAWLGDLDGDGVGDLAAGARWDDDGGFNRGAVWVLFLDGLRRGDLNCDGAFNGGDIDPFFLALGDPAAYVIAFPSCNPLLGDMNSDGRLDGGDIDPFFACLGGGACP